MLSTILLQADPELDAYEKIGESIGEGLIYLVVGAVILYFIFRKKD